MQYVNLGKSNLKVSVTGLGTAQFGSEVWGFGTKYKEKDILKVIHTAIESGINLFDTAEAYSDGLSEIILGKALKYYDRDDFVVISKVLPYNLKFDSLIKAADRSLKRLSIDTIDLYLVHYPNPFVNMGETFRAMEYLIKKEKIRYMGVSNFNSFLIKMAQKYLSSSDIVANEIEYNIVSRRAEERTIPYCNEQKIGLIAYSPFARGILTGKYSSKNPPQDRARAFYLYSRRYFLKKAQPLFNVLEEISKERGFSVAQVALSYIINNYNYPLVTIPSALNEKEVLENAKSSEIRLTYDEISRINKVSIVVGLFGYLFEHWTMRPISWSKGAVSMFFSKKYEN